MLANTVRLRVFFLKSSLKLISNVPTVGAVACEDCADHTHSVAGSDTCTPCGGQTYEDVKNNDVSVLESTKLEQLLKCFSK